MAVEVARTNISEFDKTVSMLENMTDEELQALRKVAMVITKRNADEVHLLTLMKKNLNSAV